MEEIIISIINYYPQIGSWIIGISLGITAFITFCTALIIFLQHVVKWTTWTEKDDYYLGKVITKYDAIQNDYLLPIVRFLSRFSVIGSSTSIKKK